MTVKTTPKVIKLPIKGIVVTLEEEDGNDCSEIKSNLAKSCPCEEIPEEIWFAAMYAVESMILHHAIAGVAIDNPKYIQGLVNVLEACEADL